MRRRRSSSGDAPGQNVGFWNADRLGAGTRLAGEHARCRRQNIPLSEPAEIRDGAPTPSRRRGRARPTMTHSELSTFDTKLPASMDEEAAVHDLRRARRGVRHTGERVRIALPYIVLSRFRKNRRSTTDGSKPIAQFHADEVQPRPSSENDVDETRCEAILIPTIACGLHQPEESCPPETRPWTPRIPASPTLWSAPVPGAWVRDRFAADTRGGECGRRRHR